MVEIPDSALMFIFLEDESVMLDLYSAFTEFNPIRYFCMKCSKVKNTSSAC